MSTWGTVGPSCHRAVWWGERGASIRLTSTTNNNRQTTISVSLSLFSFPHTSRSSLPQKKKAARNDDDNLTTSLPIPTAAHLPAVLHAATQLDDAPLATADVVLHHPSLLPLRTRVLAVPPRRPLDAAVPQPQHQQEAAAARRAESGRLHVQQGGRTACRVDR